MSSMDRGGDIGGKGHLLVGLAGGDQAPDLDPVGASVLPVRPLASLAVGVKALDEPVESALIVVGAAAHEPAVGSPPSPGAHGVIARPLAALPFVVFCVPDGLCGNALGAGRRGHMVSESSRQLGQRDGPVGHPHCSSATLMVHGAGAESMAARAQ